MVEWCTQNLRRNGSISRGTSHATPKERYQYTTSVDINNTRYKRTQSLIQNHMPMCAVRLRYIKAMNNNNNNELLYLYSVAVYGTGYNKYYEQDSILFKISSEKLNTYLTYTTSQKTVTHNFCIF